MKRRVCASGLQSHGFPSINRTRAFYERTLRDAYDLTLIGPTASPNGADAVLNFGGDRWWTERPRPDCPIVFAMHGGAVLNPEVREVVDHLTTADAMIVNCSSDTAILSAMFDGSSPALCQLDLPVDTTTFRPFQPAPSRRLLGMDEADLVLGFVARLVPQKNLHLFLRMLAEVRELMAPRTVRGLVVGDYWTEYPVLNYETDTYRESIDDLAAELDLGEAVAFTPAKLDDARLALVYSAMDLLVHPTNAVDENFGYSPVEAMACGTPVVGAAYGGLKDTVRDGTSGVLVDTWTTATGIRMDVQSAIDAIIRLLEDSGERLAMSRAAASYAASRFAPVTCARQLRTHVDRSIELWGADPAPVAVAPSEPVPSPPVAGRAALPASVDPPWEFFAPRVRHYVRGPVPTAATCSAVRAQAPVCPVMGGYRLRDPAWPAEFSLGSAEAALVEHCARSLSIDHALELCGPSEIDRLLADGVLIGTART